jgi:hypothetical protein
MTTLELRRQGFEFRTRKYKWGSLSLAADLTQAAAPIYSQTDEGDWISTPYQTADARHRWIEAFPLLRRWVERG